MKIMVEVDTVAGTAKVVGSTTPQPTPVTKVPFTDSDGILLIPDDDERMCPALATQPPGFSLTGWPRLVRTPQGVTFQAWGPLNKRFVAGMAGYIFGHQANTSVFTGQNGHECVPPQPDSTSGGWPLMYTYDPATKKVIGTPTVYSGEGSYNNEDELLAHLKMLDDYKASLLKPRTDPTDRKEPYPSYVSAAALLDDLKAIAFSFGVTLDGDENFYTGFGPFLSYVSQPDGSVKRGVYTPGEGGEVVIGQG